MRHRARCCCWVGVLCSGTLKRFRRVIEVNGSIRSHAHAPRRECPLRTGRLLVCRRGPNYLLIRYTPVYDINFRPSSKSFRLTAIASSPPAQFQKIHLMFWASIELPVDRREKENAHEHTDTRDQMLNDTLTPRSLLCEVAKEKKSRRQPASVREQENCSRAYESLAVTRTLVGTRFVDRLRKEDRD